MHALPALCIQDQKKRYMSQKYGKMWYRNSHTVGIRRKFGDKRTAVSFGGRGCEVSKEDLYDKFGEEVLKKLDEGMSEEDVKAWVDQAIKPHS